MNYRIALIIGRFQPFHLGHLYLLRKTLLIADKIVFGIGSASVYDENNPLSYEARREIIEKVIKNEKISKKVLKIVPLEDFFDDRKWLENLKKQVGRFDLVVSNNNWTNKIMKAAEYKVKRFPYFKRYLYEGWRIRKLLIENRKWEDRIPDYLVPNFKSLISKQFSNFQKPISIFNHVVLGGTFDHFHKGHEELIETAFKYGKKVTIGIVTKELFENKLFSQVIETFGIRKKSVSDFLKKNSWQKYAKIITFSQFTGGADKRGDIDAIVVSRLTYLNALKINELRKKNNLKLLRIIIIKDVLVEDGKLLSSERIRAGEVDRNGKNYQLPTANYELILPEEMREELRKPLGKVFNSVYKVINLIKFIKPVMTVAVGDIIVESLMKNGVEPDVNIIDFRSRRKEFSPAIGEIQLPKEKFLNKPGTINIETAKKLKELIKKGKGWLIINGEEDLLTLPVILFAPLNSLVLYGHWQFGVIGVTVTEKIKNRAKSLLKRFEI